MKVSLNLLKQVGSFDQPPERLAELIGARIGQIEHIEHLGPRYAGIVVAEIIEHKPHPNADKLGVYKIKHGSTTTQVVAGDKTLKAGDKVAFIPPGTTVPATVDDAQPLVITKRDLRGQASNGMLASARELAFSGDHVGVLKLDAGQPGQALSEVYGLDDVIFDLENKALTHRPDLFGHLGLARELSGVLGQPFKSPDWWLKLPKWPAVKQSLPLKLKIGEPKLVPRFTASIFSQVKIEPSAVQTQSWLNRLGVRPLNNVVDLTNYLMLLTGQPLHAFDYDKVVALGGTQLGARLARAGEQLTLLDGRTIKLDKSDLVITSGTVSLGLAGAMGGADSEVSTKTTNVIIEAANFDMYAIRNTSMRHGIFSEAVTRFARGQDPMCLPAVQTQVLKRMRQLGAEPASALLDANAASSPTRRISASADRINQLLGTSHPPAAMAKRLNQVELPTTLKQDKLDVRPPSWRPDLALEEDIVEEIGRLFGYDKIQARLPRRSLAPARLNMLEDLRQRAGRGLSSAGANEVLTYSGVSRQLLAAAGQDAASAFAIRNALSPDLHHMRLSLMPSLLALVNANLRRGWDRFVLYEIGVTHHKRLIEAKLPDEQPVLALVFAAKTKSAPAGAAYYEARHYLDYLLDSLKYSYGLGQHTPRGDAWLEAASAPFAPTRRAIIMAGENEIGVIGEFSSATARALKLPASAAGFELQLNRLLSAKNRPPAYRPLSKYPRVLSDLTLRVPSELPYARLAQALSAVKFSDVNIAITPLGIYQAKSGSKNVSFRLDFSHQTRTMEQSEVNKMILALAQSVKKLGAEPV